MQQPLRSFICRGGLEFDSTAINAAQVRQKTVGSPVGGDKSRFTLFSAHSPTEKGSLLRSQRDFQ